MATGVRKYPTRPRHWEVTISLGRNPATGRYRRRSFVLCPPDCADRYGHSQWPDLTARTLTEAARHRAAIADVVKGRQVSGHHRTMAQLAETWMGSGDLEAETLATYRAYWTRYIAPTFDAMAVADVTSSHVRAFRRHLADEATTHKGTPLSPATGNQVLAILKRSLSYAVDELEWIQASPGAQVKRIKQPRTEVVIPERAVVAEALRHIGAASPALGLVCIVAAVCTARRGEVLALRWGDISVDVEGRGSVHIGASVNKFGTVKSTKTGQVRTVAIDAKTLKALQTWHGLERQRIAALLGTLPDDLAMSDDWFVFPSPRGPSTPRHSPAVTRRIRQILTDAGVDERVWMHGLRHFGASQIHEFGGDATNRLGHSSRVMTLDTYTHGSSEADRATGNALGDVVWRMLDG